VAWAVSVVGGLVLLGSLLDTWQVTRLPADFTDGEQDEVTAGLAGIEAWGPAWLIAVIGLVTCTGVALSGLPALRAAARSIGLALAGAQLALLVVMSIYLDRTSALSSRLFLPESVDLDSGLGRGAYLAYLGLALVAAGLWWARPDWQLAGAGGSAGASEWAGAGGWGGAGGWAGAGAAAWDPAESGLPVPGPRPPGDPGEPGHPAGAGPAYRDSGYAGPPDLAVGPAEPFARPGDEQPWR
jgi:hypothetical protein